MKLIDKYMNTWHFSTKNQITMPPMTPPSEASVIHRVDFSESMIIKLFFLLRGLPIRRLTMQRFTETGFVMLEESGNELVLGLAAQPWRLTGNIQRLDPEQFARFDKDDYVKIVWNFIIENPADERSCITTETRILCTSAKSKRLFSVYWFFIGFFSGVIRAEMLRLIRNTIMKH